MEFAVIVCVLSVLVSMYYKEYGWSLWFTFMGAVLTGLWVFVPPSSRHALVTCTNSEDVVIKTMIGRVTTYKGSNYVSNDNETYIIPPGTTCTESKPSPSSIKE